LRETSSCNVAKAGKVCIVDNLTAVD